MGVMLVTPPGSGARQQPAPSRLSPSYRNSIDVPRCLQRSKVECCAACLYSVHLPITFFPCAVSPTLAPAVALSGEASLDSTLAAGVFWFSTSAIVFYSSVEREKKEIGIQVSQIENTHTPKSTYRFSINKGLESKTLVI